MMTCNEARVLLHALIDGELDAGHARDVETHVAACARCAAELRDFRQIRRSMAQQGLRQPAPAALRRRIEALMPAQPARPAPTRRSLLQGFALGSVASAAAAAGVMVLMVREDRDQRILGDVISAHLRSLQADHLTDVLSTDRHTVKPWFNGRLDVAPPVYDLTAQGFTLLGGRLDYIDGKGVAVIVYRRRVHIINLFVTPTDGTERSAPSMTIVQGFQVMRWTDQGLGFIAVSDISADELREFATRYEAALRAGA